MALASQTNRTSFNSRGGPRKRGPFKWLGILLVLGLLAGAGWWGYKKWSEKPTIMYASTLTSNTIDGQATQPSIENQAAEPAPPLKTAAEQERESKQNKTSESAHANNSSGLAPLGPAAGTGAGSTPAVAAPITPPVSGASANAPSFPNPPKITHDPVRTVASAPPSTTQPSAIAEINRRVAATVLTTQPTTQAWATTQMELPPLKAPSIELSEGMNLIGEGKLVEGRQRLSRLLTDPASGISVLDAQTIRDTLASVNQNLIFSPQVDPTDPLTESYIVQPPDLISKLAPRYHIPAALIEEVNHVEARKIAVGRKLKLIKGPFHAVVHKGEYRMDVFLDDSTSGQRIYIRSFQVGLGEGNSTPTGMFIIRQGGKVSNPSWSNPRTREYFEPGNPKNPIGKFWMALEGEEEINKNKDGYGIHGTIDPDSIGKQASMGCVRLRDDDIALVYKLLTEVRSTVFITP